MLCVIGSVAVEYGTKKRAGRHLQPQVATRPFHMEIHDTDANKTLKFLLKKKLLKNACIVEVYVL
ncbi:MAG: hypothetical protein HFH23_00340 [Ruminococcus sp.]|nr:hypothetical protein [Ruminococcus sp.]